MADKSKDDLKINELNGKKKVLVVEDDEDMNDLICAVLGEAGYETQSAVTGEDGFKAAVEIKPDLILLDIRFEKGEMDGLEVCRRISNFKDTKSIPIIMVTIERELSTKLAAYIAGAKRYITKPFGVDDLISEVEKTFKQKNIPLPEENGSLDARDL
ncbi:MAG TPA: response regulator [bacterium]|nr:response regulator [bacterium]